jgi:hypothetical protein
VWEDEWWEWEVYVGVGGPAAAYPWEREWWPCIGGRVGPRLLCEGRGKHDAAGVSLRGRTLEREEGASGKARFIASKEYALSLRGGESSCSGAE